MEITVKNLKVNYIDNGIPGDGREVVLFLHGWGAPITAYRTVLAPLEERYRVVAFDMPGVGGTDEPAQPLTVEDYVDFAESFAHAVDIKKCILICHSHGGRVSVGLMTRPGCKLEVTKAVFIDAAGVLPKRTDVRCSHHHHHEGDHDCGSHGHDCGSHEHTCGDHGCH